MSAPGNLTNKAAYLDLSDGADGRLAIATGTIEEPVGHIVRTGWT